MSRKIFLLILFFSSYPFLVKGQDTLRQISSSKYQAERFILHENGCFDYYLTHKHLLMYGAGTYLISDKDILFEFDSSCIARSTYSCKFIEKDTFEVVLIENTQNEVRLNYNYIIDGYVCSIGWSGTIPLSMEQDSIIFSLLGFERITVYPKSEKCNSYNINLAFRTTLEGNRPPLTLGTVTFEYNRRKKIWMRHIDKNETILDLQIQKKHLNYKYMKTKEYVLVEN